MREMVSFAGPGASMTDMGSKPRLLPVACGNSFAVRPLSVAEENAGGQVMRKVSPSFTCLGATVHLCENAGAQIARKISGRSKPRSRSAIISSKLVILSRCRLNCYSRDRTTDWQARNGRGVRGCKGFRECDKREMPRCP